MARTKLRKFVEIASFENVFENPSPRCRPHRGYFQNQQPLTLELACGWGEYVLYLGQKYPRRNFIGIDKKGERIWKGAKFALERNLRNVAFYRIHVEDLLEYFAAHEVTEIWLTFPDPYPKKSKANKRLTSPRFLELYRKVLQKNGRVHLKTDNKILFEYTLKILEKENMKVYEAVEDLYDHTVQTEAVRYKTKYERRHLAEASSIKYVCFGFHL